MKILIVVDMQNDFINGSLGTKEAEKIVPTVKKKIEKYIQSNDRVIFTRDTHKSDYLKTQEGKNLPVEHCVLGTFGWQITDEFDKYTKDEKLPIINKITFGSNELPQYIAKIEGFEKVEKIELVGLCTDICVISNAMILKAFFPEIKISVDASCCAGVTEESHKNALQAMKMCQIDVI
ncbi:MAG: isochorismatase family cysteine hydrolase [Oscillospiraceae bacterium]